jgi:hypothetical protein
VTGFARTHRQSKSMFEFYERTMHWVDLLGAELVDVPAPARTQAAFWRRDRSQNLATRLLRTS